MKYLPILFFIFLSLKLSAQEKNFETITIKSSAFSDERLNDRKIKVKLPDNYELYPARFYKVVYLFDAHSEAFFNLLTATQDYMSTHSSTFTSPVIFVGIENKYRQYEFLPKNNSDQPYKDYWDKVKLGGADELITHLTEEVFPAINNKYRTNGFNIGVGHSLGGSFLTYCLYENPDLFEAIITASPNLYYDEEQIIKSFSNNIKPQDMSGKILYMGYGKGDKLEDRFYDSSSKFENFLRKTNIDNFIYKVEELNNNDHGLIPIEVIFKGLDFINRQLTVNEKDENFYSSKNNNLVDTIKEFYKEQSNVLGITLPSIEDVKHLANNSYNMGMDKESLEIIDWAVKLYPNSWTILYTKARLHENQKQQENAKSTLNRVLYILEGQIEDFNTDDYQKITKMIKKRLSNI